MSSIEIIITLAERIHEIGIIGGTGGMGKGFAVRWCKDHNVLIGSRDAERANTSAQEYSELVKEAYGSKLMEISQVQITQQLLKNQMF